MQINYFVKLKSKLYSPESTSNMLALQWSLTLKLTTFAYCKLFLERNPRYYNRTTDTKGKLQQILETVKYRNYSNGHLRVV